MSDIEIKKVIKKARKQFNLSLLDSILPSIQYTAKQCGYAVAVHGSLEKDIDLVAVPWTKNAHNHDSVATFILKTINSYTNACFSGKPTKKPHHRYAYTIILNQTLVWIDLSVFSPYE